MSESCPFYSVDYPHKHMFYGGVCECGERESESPSTAQAAPAAELPMREVRFTPKQCHCGNDLTGDGFCLICRTYTSIFTEEEVLIVRAAIQVAKEDMKEWRRLSRVDPEKMRNPIWRL